MSEAELKPAAHRQTRYRPAPRLDPPEVLPTPALTGDRAQAIEDLSVYGMCLLEGALTADEVSGLREKVTSQAAAERALGDHAPQGATAVQQGLSNLVNKGQHYLDLVLREEVDDLAGFMLGKSFLISSITAGIFHGPTTEPQPLHRDQGQVPATADFPAACNMFWLLDDFKPERGSTWVVPGSHRWPAEYQIEPPPAQRRAADHRTCRYALRVRRSDLARLWRQRRRPPAPAHRKLSLPAVDAPAGELGGDLPAGGARYG